MKTINAEMVEVMKKELLALDRSDIFVPDFIREKYTEEINKNDYIAELFKNSEDGRIVLDMGKVNWNPALGEEDVKYILGRSELVDGMLEVLMSPYFCVPEKRMSKSAPGQFSGAKIGKVLSSILDSNILKHGGLDELQLDYTYTKKNIIEGQLSSYLEDVSFSKREQYYLVLSISPVDFLLMSDGVNWSSCMSPGGEYCSGCLPYSTGTDTIIAFLVKKSSLELQSGDFGHTEKVWRQIIYLAEDTSIIGQKSYPGERRELSDFIASFIDEQLGLNLERDESGNATFYNNGLETGYVDIERNLSGGADFVYVKKELLNQERTITINAQKKAVCFNCGCSTDCFECDAESLCDECEGGYHCCSCGDRCAEGEEIDINGDMYCEYCAENDFYYIDGLCEWVSVHDVVEVIDEFGNKIFWPDYYLEDYIWCETEMVINLPRNLDNNYIHFLLLRELESEELENLEGESSNNYEYVYLG